MIDSLTFNRDCLAAMREMPDKAFDLAVVDPPYGHQHGRRFGAKFELYTKEHLIKWDKPPEAEYFEELFRVTKNQIIFGMNYFNLPPTKCFIFWRKPNVPEDPRFSMGAGELIWTSWQNRTAKYCVFNPQDRKRFHPTQKPVALYDWIFKYFSEPGQTVLDTHLGSGSSRIAAYKARLNFTGFETDVYYFELEERRFNEFLQQYEKENN